ncbi:hypothetical protein [Spirosoma endbachense]|uniref:Uncharacterized protein n=1 Tax=Spirosoma endbachense TaxID=2666025 RepID=A0A6P1VXK5_9BACT|nr:hypothetical protein [Spirosoma endbachense]QHV96116.1 hypothetical protein GJR95_14350 [Spirosoma endbachense]
MLLHRISSRQLLANPACFVSGFSRTCFVWLPVFMLLMLTQTGYAQIDQTTPEIAAGTDPDRGYWRLKTQAATRSTLIQFFGLNKQLLYEEILPEKWVKLSRKNQKQFDQLLAQLLANQLLADRIKTEPLPPTLVEPVPSQVAVRSNTSHYYSSTMAAYRVHAYVNPTGKLYLIVDNPDRLRYKILVSDQHNREVYEEFTNHNKYMRKLDLSALPYDSYQLIVQIDNKPFIYKISRRDTRFAYSIQSPDFVNQQTANEQKREVNKPSPVPDKIDL